MFYNVDPSRKSNIIETATFAVILGKNRKGLFFLFRCYVKIMPRNVYFLFTNGAQTESLCSFSIKPILPIKV